MTKLTILQLIIIMNIYIAFFFEITQSEYDVSIVPTKIIKWFIEDDNDVI